MKLPYSKTIAVDLMGGDHDPAKRLKAVDVFAGKQKTCLIKLFVDERYYKKNESGFHQKGKDNIHVVQTPQCVAMDEKPLHALKYKKDSSLSLAIKAVADGAADAILTAGNTAALVVLAKAWLQSVNDIDRPALATVLPGYPKPTLLLDVGATLDYRADDLFNLARLGDAAAKQLLSCSDRPEIAILNVGTEHVKGNDTVRQADRLLQDSEFNYIGFCEGNHLFEGYADVVCCDGFVGNAVLKACEGMMDLIFKNDTHLFVNSSKNPIKKLFSVFRGFKFNPSQYNGALLLGLNACVMKSHGKSDSNGFLAALQKTWEYINN